MQPRSKHLDRSRASKCSSMASTSSTTKTRRRPAAVGARSGHWSRGSASSSRKSIQRGFRKYQTRTNNDQGRYYSLLYFHRSAFQCVSEGVVDTEDLGLFDFLRFSSSRTGTLPAILWFYSLFSHSIRKKQGSFFHAASMRDSESN